MNFINQESDKSSSTMMLSIRIYSYKLLDSTCTRVVMLIIIFNE